MASIYLRAPLTHGRLLERLHYDPTTGIFRWRTAPGGKAKAGDVAGYLNDGYVKITLDGATYSAHRLAWAYVTGDWPEGEVDHWNGVRHDNCWTNLRDITHRANMENQRVARKTNKLGVLGVSKHHRSDRYRASINVGGKIHRLGWFDTPEAAHATYVQAKRELHAGCTL